MKRMNNIIITCLGLLALLVGCTEITNPPYMETKAGTGRVRLTITGTGERTILPETPVFSKYEFIFEPLDGQEGHDNVTVNAGESANTTVELVKGNWTIIAKGYVHISGITGIPDGDYRAAEGREDITVNSGQFHNLSIDLKGGVQAGEKGIFAWEITLPDDAHSANMAILTLGGVEIQLVNLMDTPSGTTALDAGYYLLAVSLDNQRPKAEILHIYAGLTSRIERTLYRAPAFNDINNLADYLDKAPANTAATPYEIILYGLNIESDFYQDGDPLRKLFNALNEKYVNFDLGDCAGQTISSTNFSNSRPNRDKLVSIILPERITSIGSNAFNGCTSLALAELPEGLTSIEGGAFYGCTSLALTALPAGLTSIRGEAFSGCTSLALTVLPAGITYIEGGAFSGCTGLALTELPAGITSISGWAFSGCTSLALAVLPAGITSIGQSAFSGCTSLALAVLPEGITSIGDGAFFGCTSLALAVLPEGITSISGWAFSGCTSLALAVLPEGITSIGDGAFFGCTSLALTALSAGITSIGYGAFQGCTSLALTVLPAGITSISGWAFSGCTSLALAELPEGITSIGDQAFRDCTGLALVICHAVTPPTLESNVFYGIPSTMQIKVPSESVTAYKAASGWSDYADRIMAIDEYHINVAFTGPSERVIPITRSISNNLSKTGGGSITLKVTEDFAQYEWFIGGTKAATGKEVTLQANNTAFTTGPNWITAVVYEGTGPGAAPYSGVFMVRVAE